MSNKNEAMLLAQHSREGVNNASPILKQSRQWPPLGMF